MPPERLPKPQMPPVHPRGATVPAPPQPQEQYELAGVAAHPGLKAAAYAIPEPPPVHDHDGHGGGSHDHGAGGRRPPSDYEDLTRGPVVVSQYPAPGTSRCVKSKVDLVALID